MAQIVFTRQTGRDYRFFFECLAQETSASVFKNNPQLLQENAPPPPTYTNVYGPTRTMKTVRG